MSVLPRLLFIALLVKVQHCIFINCSYSFPVETKPIDLMVQPRASAIATATTVIPTTTLKDHLEPRESSLRSKRSYAFNDDELKSLIIGNSLKNIDTENVPIEGKEATDMADYQPSSCQLVQIVHILQHPGCQTKAISSFACSGACLSYVQTSTSKFWQHERSCSCCQQTGSQEATFTLDCPSLDPPYKKFKTYAPIDCLCRSCTDLGKEDLRPHELVEALAGSKANGMNDGMFLDRNG